MEASSVNRSDRRQRNGQPVFLRQMADNCLNKTAIKMFVTLVAAVFGEMP